MTPSPESMTHKCAVCDLSWGPGRSEGEYGLDGNVEPLNVEQLEEDLGGVFAVLRRVKRRFGLIHIM